MDTENIILNSIKEREFPKNMDNIVMADEEYQKLSENEDAALDKLSEFDLDRQVRYALDEVLTASNACAARYNVMAYEQGFWDCLSILKEMKVI